MPEGDTTVECKDCSGTFIFTAEERANFDARGYSPLVRCADCRKAKRERFASFDGESTTTKPPEVPTYDAATEAKLDAWVAAKRSKDFTSADRLRAALRADGIDTEVARPIGYVPPMAPGKKRSLEKKVKCFNCGSKGHRSDQCRKRPAASTKCYHCGSEDHQAKDCPNAPEATPFDPSTARCFSCGQHGHLAVACPRKSTPGSSTSACYLCGMEGHVSRYCPKARDKPLPPGIDTAKVETMRAEWSAARAAKDYEKADSIRAELLALGVNPNKQAKKS